VRQDHEDEQDLEQHGGDDEEVHGDQASEMFIEKTAPRRRRGRAPAAQIFGHRRLLSANLWLSFSKKSTSCSVPGTVAVGNVSSFFGALMDLRHLGTVARRPRPIVQASTETQNQRRVFERGPYSPSFRDTLGGGHDAPGMRFEGGLALNRESYRPRSHCEARSGRGD
jgi:hypothetical protein